MIRVVIDTNVVVSANLVDEGPSAVILSLAINRKILMFVSTAVLAEYEKVLNRPRLKFNPERIKAVMASSAHRRLGPAYSNHRRDQERRTR